MKVPPSSRKNPLQKKKKEKWFVYMLECGDGSYYTGIAKDPQKRFAAHSAGRGARYTRTHKPVRIVYGEPQKDISCALKREIQIKRMSKAQKISLAKTKNPGKKKQRRPGKRSLQPPRRLPR